MTEITGEKPVGSRDLTDWIILFSKAWWKKGETEWKRREDLGM